MGKRKHEEASDSDDKATELMRECVPGQEAKKKQKKKDKKEKKKVKKKAKKDAKKVKKDAKKVKKQQESSSSGSSSSAEAPAPDAEQASPKAEAAAEPAQPDPAPQVKEPVQLPPPEDGILRFEFRVEDVGPLGLRFSGGFPPIILAVNAGSNAAKKGVPPNHEVHAINGLALVPQNRDHVMEGLKSRPVTIDVRPTGWKPKEKVKELEKKRKQEEADRNLKIELEERRRGQVAQEQQEQQEKEAAEKAARQERAKAERQEAERLAREARQAQKAKDEEWNKVLTAEPTEWRKAAEALMEASYGTDIQIDGRRGVPLRLFTRFKDVAWIWAGQAQSLIGGGPAGESTF